MSDILINSDQMHAVMVEAALKVFKDKLESGYKSPLEPLIDAAFAAHSDGIRKAINKAVGDCVGSESFGAALIDELNRKLANLAIAKCTGLVEKSFNNLMQDQVLRTKLQSAVLQIIEGAGK